MSLTFKVVAIVLLGVNLSAQAQSKRFLLEETTAKPGAVAAFEPAQKEYCVAVVRGGAPSCSVLSPTTFSPPNVYYVFLAFTSFKHYDEGTYTSKGLTPDQAHDLSQRRLPTIAQNFESAVELQDSASSPDTNVHALAEVIEFHVQPGKEADFLSLFSEVLKPAAAKKNFASFELYRSILGGDPSRFFLIRHLRSFAELDQSADLRQVVPARSLPRFDQTYSDCVKSMLVSIMKLRTDLGSTAQ